MENLLQTHGMMTGYQNNNNKTSLIVTFLCLSLFFVFSHSNEVTIPFSELVQRDGLLNEKFSIEPFTGKAKGIETGSVKEGKRDGKWAVFWENGQLREKATFKNGKLVKSEKIITEQSQLAEIIQNKLENFETIPDINLQDQLSATQEIISLLSEWEDITGESLSFDLEAATEDISTLNFFVNLIGGFIKYKKQKTTKISKLTRQIKMF